MHIVDQGPRHWERWEAKLFRGRRLIPLRQM
jgi:hypothetical protein